MRYAVHDAAGDQIASCLYAVDAVSLAASHHVGVTVRVSGQVMFTVEKERMTLMECVHASGAVRKRMLNLDRATVDMSTGRAHI